MLNDRDGDLVNFFRVLRDQPEALERACRLTPYARDEWEAADFGAEGLDDVEKARRWWVRSSQSFAQKLGHNTGWSTSVKRGSNNARSAWNHRTESLWCNRSIDDGRLLFDVVAQ